MEEIPYIPGLFLQTTAVDSNGVVSTPISSELELEVINFLDRDNGSMWWRIPTPPHRSIISRRVQHFGRKYDYQRRRVAPPNTEIVNLEGPILQLAHWLSPLFGGVIPDQCIVNEYLRKENISPHIDQPEDFGPVVVSISLLEDTNFIFDLPNTKEKYNIFVPKRSVLAMTGDSRYKWRHSIPSRVTYVDSSGTKHTKSTNYRRISLTYRTVIF